MEKIEIIYKMYSKLMLKESYFILNDFYLAQDALSEAFIKIMKNMNKIDINDFYKTKKYCIKIIRNCSIDIYKKNKFEQCKDFTIDNINNEYNDEYSREIFDNIYSILLQIPEKYSKIIIMKIEGYSYLEISNKTGKNIQNVRQIYSRGRKMILKKLNNYNKKL